MKYAVLPPTRVDEKMLKGTLPLDSTWHHLSKLKAHMLLDPTAPFLRTFFYRSTNLIRQSYDECKDV